MRRWLFALLCALALPASAHIVAAGQGAVRLQGDSAYALISVPVVALAGFDDNHDGLIERAEVDAHRALLLQQASQLFDVSADGVAGQIVFEDLLLSHPGTHGDADIVLIRRYQWRAPVQHFQLTTRLFENAAAADRQLLLRVLQGERSEAVLLTRLNSSHRFFDSRATVLRTFISAGVEHILLGPDHLLFLLTVLVAGASWRYWLAVVTSFTVAHSITLALAALGYIEPPAHLIEPLIAASIVLLALDNLVRGRRAIMHRPVLVFACGLLHGMGIASALGGLGLSSENRLPGLFGFNAGVEVGQLAFVACALAAMAAVRRWAPQGWPTRMLRASSFACAAVGTWWMVTRAFA